MRFSLQQQQQLCPGAVRGEKQGNHNRPTKPSPYIHDFDVNPLPNRIGEVISKVVHRLHVYPFSNRVPENYTKSSTRA